MAQKIPIRLMFRASASGIQLVVATFVGFMIGHFLDGYFDTTPWLTIIFFLLGIFTGFRDLFKMVKEINDSDNDGDGNDDNDE